MPRNKELQMRQDMDTIPPSRSIDCRLCVVQRIVNVFQPVFPCAPHANLRAHEELSTLRQFYYLQDVVPSTPKPANELDVVSHDAIVRYHRLPCNTTHQATRPAKPKRSDPRVKMVRAGPCSYRPRRRKIDEYIGL